MDDFGTAYSSLAYLRNFPVDRVKIDRSFVGTMGDEHSTSSRLVEAIVSMAHALELDVVAEGVEDSGQLDTLRSVGVDVGQGFHLGRPQAADDLWRPRVAEQERPPAPTAS